MKQDVQFRDKDDQGRSIHEYRVNGLPVPSVTYVLDKRGFTNYGNCPEDNMEAARERGNIGHEVTKWYDEAYPDECKEVAQFEAMYLEESLHPWSAEILEAWIGFRREFEFKPLIIEKPMTWKINGMPVCGTPDRYGMSKLGPMVVELKFTAKIELACKFQLAAYVGNFDLWVKGNKRPLRYAAHFKDGKVIPIPFTRTKDEAVFAAALSVTHDLWNLGHKV